MKKYEYEKPICECIRFDARDIIATSSVWYGPDYPGGGDPNDGGTSGDDQIGDNWWFKP
ncbi:MAG: hypothetical protein Q4C01_04525 [Clostridia bacterium]|nr:hypothetical protein [Clostridia bacterium]